MHHKIQRSKTPHSVHMAPKRHEDIRSNSHCLHFYLLNIQSVASNPFMRSCRLLSVSIFNSSFVFIKSSLLIGFTIFDDNFIHLSHSICTERSSLLRVGVLELAEDPACGEEECGGDSSISLCLLVRIPDGLSQLM